MHKKCTIPRPVSLDSPPDFRPPDARIRPMTGCFLTRPRALAEVVHVFWLSNTARGSPVLAGLGVQPLPGHPEPRVRVRRVRHRYRAAPGPGVPVPAPQQRAARATCFSARTVVVRELGMGLLAMPAIFALVIAVQLSIRAFAPSPAQRSGQSLRVAAGLAFADGRLPRARGHRGRRARGDSTGVPAPSVRTAAGRRRPSASSSRVSPSVSVTRCRAGTQQSSPDCWVLSGDRCIWCGEARSPTSRATRCFNIVQVARRTVLVGSDLKD